VATELVRRISLLKGCLPSCWGYTGEQLIAVAGRLDSVAGVPSWECTSLNATVMVMIVHEAHQATEADTNPCVAEEVADWQRAGQVPALVQAFDWYEARLRTNNAVDFDDLLSLCVALLRDEVRSWL